MSEFVEVLAAVEVPGDPVASAEAVVRALRLSKSQSACLFDLIVEACHRRKPRPFVERWLAKHKNEHSLCERYMALFNETAAFTHASGRCVHCGAYGAEVLPGSPWLLRHRHFWSAYWAEQDHDPAPDRHVHHGDIWRRLPPLTTESGAA